jgi:peptide/nickel transport system substrate-binding protein/oligopeptide transport system substrate-binding protein
MKGNIRSVLFFALLAVMSLLLTGCGSESGLKRELAGSDRPRPGGVFRFGMTVEAQSLDPAHFYEASGIEIGKEIYDGLVAYDRGLQLVPAHAERWENRDNMTFIFHLKKGTKFHNGREVTAADFKYSLERLLDPKTKSEISGMLLAVEGAGARLAGKTEEISGIKVKGPYTLEIKLEKPFAGFLYVLAHPGTSVVDRQSVEAAGSDFGTPAASPDTVVGSGPFKFKGWQPALEVSLVRNDAYYGYKPYLDEIEYKFFKEESTVLNEYRAGGLDFVDRLPPGLVKHTVSRYPGLTRRTEQLSEYFYAFNMDKPPFKDNLKLRQAISAAVDRNAIATMLEGEAVPATGVVPRGISAAADVTGLGGDRRIAAQLLAEAGYPGGQGLGQIELKYNISEVNQKVAEIVQEQLRGMGISLKLVGMEPGAFINDLVNGNTQMFRFGWGADYPDPDSFLYPLYHSGQIGNNNLSFYSNQAVDDLLDKARGEQDAGKRLELYRRAEAKIIADMPAVYLYSGVETDLLSRRVRGMAVNKLDLKPMDRVWLTE